MSEKKMTTEQPQEQNVEAGAAVELEREAKAEQDIGIYTHHFNEPFTFHCISEDSIKDTTVETLTFNWKELTGGDYLDIEDELMMRGKTLVVPAFTGYFLLGMAVRACTLRTANGVQAVDARAMKSMPIRDFQEICKRARSFLPRLGS